MDVIGCWSVVGCGSSPLPRKRKTTLKCFGGSACGYVQKVPNFPITNDSSYVAMWESFDVHVSCFGMYLGYLGEAKTNRIYLPPWRLANLWYVHHAAPKPEGNFLLSKKKVPWCWCFHRFFFVFSIFDATSASGEVESYPDDLFFDTQDPILIKILLMVRKSQTTTWDV